MRAIGIDYGTTTSWIAVQGVKEITLASLKSACCILKDGQKEFGQRAYNSRANGTFIRSPKTSIAKRSWKDFRDKYSYELNDIIEEFSQKLIVEGCRNFGNNENVLHVTVTIPNCYDGAQMKYMRDCFEKVLSERFPNRFKLHLLPEPIAAALYYVLGENKAMNFGHVLVCDMGGGTTDLALIKFYKDNSSIKFEVVATMADATLGGDALDNELFNRAQRDWRVSAEELDDANAALQKITEAKEILSTQESCPVSVDDTSGLSRICFVSSSHIRQYWENNETDQKNRPGNTKTDQKTSKPTRKVNQTDQKKQIIEMLKSNPNIARSEIAQVLGIHDSSVKRRLDRLVNDGFICRIGADKGGHWKVIKEIQ